jgi:hypothetical protein
VQSSLVTATLTTRLLPVLALTRRHLAQQLLVVVRRRAAEVVAASA